jgi:hypothetical protein
LPDPVPPAIPNTNMLEDYTAGPPIGVRGASIYWQVTET